MSRDDLKFLDDITPERCTAIARLLTMDTPRGRWKERSRTVIIRVMRGWSPWLHNDIDSEVHVWEETWPITRKLTNAYPFGERAHAPYKAWLDELRHLREIAMYAVGEFTQEMRDIIDVARDAEEEGTASSLAKAVGLLAQIDYPILLMKCGVCGKELTDRPCVDINTDKAMIVPHEGRLPLATRPQVSDADLPLFGGAP